MSGKNEKIVNFIYYMGGAIVILGAFAKATHISIPGIGANGLLGAGLLVEAGIFAFSAFLALKDNSSKEYAWENVYPELLDENAEPKPRTITTTNVVNTTPEFDGGLTNKLDKMLAEAKLDAHTIENLKAGIDKLSASVEAMSQSAEQSEKFNEELKTLTNNLNNLNKVYGNMLSAMKS